MTFSTFQKLTIVSCVVLCVALLLPKMLLSRGKKDAAQTDGPPGHFPPMLHRQPVPEEQRRKQISRAHNPEAIARAKGAGTGASTGGKSNLAGQIIPIYGFGILLYILYILFKITSKGKTAKPPESRYSPVRSENTKRKITDFELAQLQDRLNETKEMIDRMISKANHSPESVSGVAGVDQEERLLFQLKEITRVMQDGRLIEGIPPKTDDHSHTHEWEDFPQDCHDDVDQHFCCLHSSHLGTNTQMRTDTSEPSGAEETDERDLCPEFSAEINDSEERNGSDVCVNDALEEHTLKSGDEKEKTDAETEREISVRDIRPSSVSDTSVIRQRNKK